MPKLELMQDIMHVYETSNFKKDWINTNREKVETDVLDAQGQPTP